MRKLAAILVITVATVAASAQKKPGSVAPKILPGLCHCGCMPAAMHCNGSGGGGRLCTPTSSPTVATRKKY